MTQETGIIPTIIGMNEVNIPRQSIPQQAIVDNQSNMYYDASNLRLMRELFFMYKPAR